MFKSIRSLFGSLADRRARQKRRASALPRRRANLGVERLEERALMAADLNDTIGEAAANSNYWVPALVSTTKPSSITGSIASSADVDIWQVDLRTLSAQGEYIEFDLDRTNGSSLLGVLRVFDAQGKQLRQAGGGDPNIVRLCTKPGMYYVGVSASPNDTYLATTGNGDTGGAPFIGGYKLTVTNRGPDRDDQIREAWPSDQSIRSGNVTGSNVDMYAFDAKAGQRYTIDAVKYASPFNYVSAKDILLRVFDSNGKQMASTGAVYKFSTSGKYFVGVSRGANSAYNPLTGDGDKVGSTLGGDYSLKISKLNGPVFHTQHLFTNGFDYQDNGMAWSTMPGILSFGSQVNLYSFTITKPTGVAAYTLLPTGSTANVTVRVFDVNGKQVGPNNPSPLLQEGKRQLLYLEAGSYFVGVTAKGNDAYDIMTGVRQAAGSGIGRYELTVVR